MSTAPVSAQIPNPTAIFDTINAYQRSAALKAAIELDIFTQISKQARTPEEIASRVGATVRGIRILCDYMTILGLLSKNEGRYALTTDSAAFLDRNSPSYIGNATGFLLDPRITSSFADLAKVIRSGKPGDGVVEHDNPLWVEFARHMASLSFGTAQSVAGLVAGSGPIRVLDIAAGHGLYGIAVAQKNPQARVTALDWPAVLAVAREHAAKFGVADRYSTIEGDAFEVDFGGPYDMVLVTGFFHHFDKSTCERLMRRVRAGLSSNGRCVAVDFVPNDDRISPPGPASFAMTMLSATPAGDAYTFAEYQAMFTNAGFASATLHPLQGFGVSVIVARER